jgi:AraC-like DNA-binding protein
MAALLDFLNIDAPASALQRLRAGFSGHAYNRHRHETYAVGVTEAGLQCFHYRGAAWASTTGRVIVLYPDEAHDGHAGAPAGFVYSMLYIDPSLIAAALGGRALPFCGEPVFDDPALRRMVAHAFVDFPQPIDDLALPTFITMLAEALSRRAGAVPPATRVSPKALVTARALLSDATGSVTAATLEAETGVDRYALARGFRACFGTSPHRYLIGRRLDRVKSEITRGISLADAAYAAGFADQSHMTRHFKSRFGLTPGRYAALCTAELAVPFPPPRDTATRGEGTSVFVEVYRRPRMEIRRRRVTRLAGFGGAERPCAPL